jgi:hypothetical protein
LGSKYDASTRLDIDPGQPEENKNLFVLDTPYFES